MASISMNPVRPENEVMSAFHEVAPSASTSGTTSTLIQKPSYDVFINHRGPDVKQTLASSIYKILGDMKVSAFLDSEELEYGDFLPTTLEAVIRGATLQIAIFSKNYAESPWCLAELSCMLKSGAKIVPVFYYVEPTDVRYVAQRKGIYADAFERHKKKRRYSPEKLKEWENALHEVSFYIGEIIKNNEDEMKLFKNIVNIVLKEIRNVPLMVAKHPVGLSKIIEDFENTLPLVQCDQGAQIVGIWGMGGSGKTTLAKELYNRKSSFMERSSFIFDIREAKEKLHKKQIQLLNDFGLNQTFDNIEQGKANLASRLRSFRVLIVMDDVDHTDQLDALLPAKESLVSGSLIIVTTREYEVLTSWGISSVYKMRALDPSNAEQLFCWHAFLQPSPLNGFEKLVKMFIEACDGLPLSLKVFGGQLYGKCEKQYWESLFQKISRILPTDIKGKLKVSYDALDDEDKEAFLDTACFLIGERNSLAIEFWQGSGWSGLYTWQRLLNKCLVEVDDKNCIRMHDHLRDIGREIANRHSPTRLWLPQQIVDYDKETKKRNGIRGIKAVALENKELLYKEELLLLAPSLAGLKLLVIRGDYFKQVIGEVPRELVWLCWFNIGQRNLPTWLSLKNLRVLQLSEHFGRQEHHLEELWKAESDAPLQLRELVISNCYKFQRFPNSIGCLRELKKIVITGHGNNISSLPEEFCHLQFLEHLELRWCEMLSLLPSNFGNLRNLRFLDLSRCTELKSLPVSFKNLILLQYLNLEMCRKLILRSDDLQNITKLEFLSLFRCEQLEELPHHITNQVSLKELYLGGGKMLRELPMEIGQLSRLRKMRIGGHFISLPNSLGDLSSLADLSICDSTNLESLPTSLGDLSSLTHLSIQYCGSLESLPTSLGDLSLTNLAICGCSKLKCLPSSIGHLNHLEHLEISECSISQVDFGAASLSFALNNLKWMELKQTEVCRISISDDCFPCLQTLELDRNYHLTEIGALPLKLEWLHIKSCTQLDVLPSFAQLTCLREFDLEGCDRIEKIDGLEDCTKLEILRLHTCSEVPSIESLEQMKELRQVELKANKGSAIESCIQTIKKWPDGIIICTRAIPDASSLVDSFKCGLSPDLFVVDSLSNKDILCTSILQEKHTSNGKAIMVGFVVNNVSARQLKIALFHDDNTCGSIISEMGIGEGRWALIGVFTQRSRWNSGKDLFSLCTLEHQLHVEVKAEVERGSAVRGEEQRLVKASLRLLHSISI